MYDVKSEQYQIFKKGSPIYFFYALFFPKEQRQDIFDLYSFVRIIDELIDQQVPKIELYKYFKQEYFSPTPSNKFIKNFHKLEQKYDLEKNWTIDLFKAMEMDLTLAKYQTFEEFHLNLYGVSEVIGLYMHRIMRVPLRAENYARELGKAMQYLNVTRDIKIDRDMLNRQYIPQELLDKFGLQNLSDGEINKNKDKFILLVTDMINRYEKIQARSEKGYKFLPKQYLIPIKSAADAYKLTAMKIKKNPMLVLRKKVKPSKFEMLKILITNIFYNPV